ncbi:hypothetical protein M2132_000591 [Dysgonomonas sp. PH5-45]|uniref:hypothetical protein n=1 Tax=unclassified Dysgonomonas TaxID=2630389 RepID=UPI002473776B|nr:MULTISPECIES: hypothetical protein [unclassified Dysgonomonas]MDH6354264.1 hypothetical protein [Dysgonomonas sp. PH5-45]MDH6387165.1 hypothetical protein [Dysgonomonas sp. PH5-37]
MCKTSKYFLITITITVFWFASLRAQIGINEEKKSFLLNSTTSFKLQQSPSLLSPSKTALYEDNKYAKTYYRYRLVGLDDLLKENSPYKIHPDLYTYKGTTPLNLMPPGSLETVYMGGHFYPVSNAGTLSGVGGLNLTGWEPKKLSAKTKAIIKAVYGRNIDDE